MGGGASKRSGYRYADREEKDYARYLTYTKDILDQNASKRLENALDQGMQVEQWYKNMNNRYGAETKKVILDVIAKVDIASKEMRKTYPIPQRASEFTVHLGNELELPYYIFMDYFFKTQCTGAFTSVNIDYDGYYFDDKTNKTVFKFDDVRRRNYALRRTMKMAIWSDEYQKEKPAYAALVIHLSNLLYGVAADRELLELYAQGEAKKE